MNDLHLKIYVGHKRQIVHQLVCDETTLKSLKEEVMALSNEKLKNEVYFIEFCQKNENLTLKELGVKSFTSLHLEEKVILTDEIDDWPTTNTNTNNTITNTDNAVINTDSDCKNWMDIVSRNNYHRVTFGRHTGGNSNSFYNHKNLNSNKIYAESPHNCFMAVHVNISSKHPEIFLNFGNEIEYSTKKCSELRGYFIGGGFYLNNIIVWISNSTNSDSVNYAYLKNVKFVTSVSLTADQLREQRKKIPQSMNSFCMPESNNDEDISTRTRQNKIEIDDNYEEKEISLGKRLTDLEKFMTDIDDDLTSQNDIIEDLKKRIKKIEKSLCTVKEVKTQPKRKGTKLEELQCKIARLESGTGIQISGQYPGPNFNREFSQGHVDRSFCQNCRRKNDSLANFCQFCGSRL